MSSEPAAPQKQFARKSQTAPPAPKAEAPPAAQEPKPEPAAQPPPSPPPGRPPADPVVEVPPAPAVSGELNAAAVRSMWSTVREKVRQRSRTIDVMLAGAIVRAVEGDTLVLSHESTPLAKRLVEQRNSDVIREALKDALGVDWKIRCDAATPATAPSEPEPQSVAPPAPQRDDDEEDMLAEAGNDTSDVPRRDPEEAALELLQTELGARRIDGG